MSATSGGNGYAETFRSLEGSGPDWLRAMRREAYGRFESLGYPTTRLEAWRYTNLAPLTRTRFAALADRPARQPVDKELDGYVLWDPEAIRIVFVDGRFAPRYSQLDPVRRQARVLSLAAALAEKPGRLEGRLGTAAGGEDQPFVALNTALWEDGALVEVPAGMDVERPIHLLHLCTNGGAPFVSHPRNLLLLGEGSRATVVETWAGPEGGTYLTNAVTEVLLGANASLDHYKDQEESLEAFHVGFTAARLERDARFRSHSLAFGAALSRTDLHAAFAAPGGECGLHGLYVVEEERHADHFTFVDHAVPRCRSDQAFRGVLDDRARGVFTGRVLVQEGATGTEAHQQNKNLLLSDRAVADSKPSLEIFHDDVVCTHGAAIGQLEEDALFYLRSRGLSLPAARVVLTRAFASAVTKGIQVAPLLCRIDRLLYDRLERTGAGAEVHREEVVVA